MNREGLTFDEWLDAAEYGPPADVCEPIPDDEAIRAWEAGVDPCEYASPVARAERSRPGLPRG